MKLNIDCIRDIMIVIEDLDFKQSINIDRLCECLPNYSEDELHYTSLKLYEAGFIDAIVISIMSVPGEMIKCINELTYNGHVFLDNIRNDNVFAETKSRIAKAVGSASIDVIAQVAVSVLRSKLGI